MKRWSTAILSVLLIGFAAYSGYLSMENRSLKAQLENRSLAAAPVKATAPQETEAVVDAADEVPALEGRRGFRGEDEESFTREEMLERRRQQRTQGVERMLAALDDPEMRLDMIERNMGRIDRAYEDLFKRLKLPPEELDALKTMMAEQGLLRMEGQMRSMLAEEGDRDAVREDYKEQREQLSQDIFALLGEDQAAQFKYFSNTMEYRGDVDNIERSLSFTDTPMTVRQSEGLVKAFATVDKSFEYSYDLEQLRRSDRSQITQEVVDTYYQEREIYDAKIFENAARVLNEQQLTALAAQQISDREREQREMQYQLDNPDTGGRDGFVGGFRGGGGGQTGGFRGGGGRGGR